MMSTSSLKSARDKLGDIRAVLYDVSSDFGSLPTYELLRKFKSAGAYAPSPVDEPIHWAFNQTRIAYAELYWMLDREGETREEVATATDYVHLAVSDFNGLLGFQVSEDEDEATQLEQLKDDLDTVIENIESALELLGGLK